MALRDILVRFGIVVDQEPLREASNSVNGLVIQFARLQRIAGFAIAALGGVGLVSATDEWINLQNRLKSITNSTREFEYAQQGVIDVARKALAPIGDVAVLYQRYTQATEHLNIGQDGVLDFTHRLVQAAKIGGSSAQELRGALIQLGQGIATDFKAGGQELNSILEQAPKVAKIIANAVKPGMAPQALKEAARAGKLTGETVVKAMRAAGPELDILFAKRDRSFEDIRIKTMTELMLLVEKILPHMKRFIGWLERGVDGLREWTENGDALRTGMSALIVVASALAVAFSPLAATIAAVAAPLLGLFIIVDDIVGFMMGHDSLIGRFFEKFAGEGGAEAARNIVKDLWEDLKSFFKWLSEPERWAATWQNLYLEALKWFGMLGPKLADIIGQAVRGGLGDRVADFLNIPKASKDVLGGKEDLEAAYARRDALLRQGIIEVANPDGTTRQVTSSDPEYRGLAQRMSGNAQLYNSDRFAPQYTDPMMRYGQRQYGREAPAITNNINIAGSATPETARQVARAAGNATADALGRDRSAIGAAVGVP